MTMTWLRANWGWALAGGVLGVAILAASWVTSNTTPEVAAALFLGAATIWLGWGSRDAIRQASQFRAQEAHDRTETALRSALLEQLDECRRWSRWQPERSSSETGQMALIHRLPTFKRLRQVLQREPIDPACRSRILWRMDQLTELVEDWVKEEGSGAVSLLDDVEWGKEWEVQFGYHQEIVGLLLGAATQSQCLELVDSFCDDPWLQPRCMGISRVLTETGEVTQHQLPPWPADPAYDQWSPMASDRTAKQLSAERSAHIAAALQQGQPAGYTDDSTISLPQPTTDL